MNARVIAVLTLALGLTACGRGPRIYTDPIDPRDPSINNRAGSGLPSGFYDESVNFASVTVALDGAS